MDRTEALEDGEGGRTLPVLPFALVRWIDQLNDRVGRATSWLTAVMVIVTTSDVLLRYVFNTSFVFIQLVGLALVASFPALATWLPRVVLR